MENFSGSINSKLPGVGTSIFAVMSALANEYKAINLSQGFPDFPVADKLISLVNQYMKKGYNQYAPMQGVPALREAIAAKVQACYGAVYHPDKEITVTAGGTQAIYTAISAFIREGDEAIVIEPAYDSYVPAILLNGGIPKYARLQHPSYTINWNDIKKLISHNTRLIILNTPHNPSGSILTAADMKALEKLTDNTDILVISDEVYEHLIFDGQPHESVCRYTGLAGRSIIIGSFGKTFHATGWKMGYALAPANLMSEFRKTHQFVVFTCNTPIQYALAEYMKNPSHWQELPDFYQKKRDYFQQLLSGSRFGIIPCHGTYFQLLDYSSISGDDEFSFAKWLTTEKKVGAIPVSVFYHKPIDNHVLRVCFAKKEETLEKAAEILCKI